MLPGFIAGYYDHDQCHIDLNKLCRLGDFRMIHASVVKIDVKGKLVFCNDGRPPLRYDVLSIDVGITPKTIPNCPRITPVKPIDRFGARWTQILARVLSTAVEDNHITRVAIVGGGGGGVELAFSIHHRFTQELKQLGRSIESVNMTIYTRGDAIMASHSKRVRQTVSSLLEKKRINIVYDAHIAHVDESDPSSTSLVSADGRRFPFDEAIWCTDAQAQSWLKESGLETTDDGFVCVKVSHQLFM